MSVASYCRAKSGARPDLVESEAYLAADRVLDAVGLGLVPINKLTAEPYEA